MKKLLLFFTILTSVYSYQYDAKVYIGIGAGSEVESYTNVPNNIDSTSAPYVTLKIGYGDQRAYAIEFSLNYINNDNNIFSKQDKAKYGLDITFIKAYPLTQYFYPFAKVGFGAGEMDIDKETLGEGAINISLTNESSALQRNRISYSSYNVGFGAYIPFSKTFELEISYMYRYNSYQSFDYTQDDGSITSYRLKSHINQIYFGLNKRF